MGASGSLRNVNIDSIPFSATGDGNVAFNDRFEKESIPHSGGNLIKYTLASGDAESVKLTLNPSEYDILYDIAAGLEDIPLSITLADGSSFKTQGRVNLGPYQSEDFSCEVTFMTSTGVWDKFTAS